MTLRSLLLMVAVVFSITVQAGDTRHGHQLSTNFKASPNVLKKMMLPGYCEIEILNRSFEPVHVSGTFIDGGYLEAFDIFPHEYPHYITLQYWGCQPGMYLTISNFNGYVIYSGYTPVYQTITVYPLLGNTKSIVKMQPKAR